MSRIRLIEDAMANVGANDMVSICGAVIEFGFPYKSRGTDYFCGMKIFDESTQEPGFPINFFAEDVTQFPHVRSSGDVIILHNILMKNYNEAGYALFSKKHSSFAVLEGASSVDFNPYHVSSNFDINNDDRVSVLRIRAWLVNHRFDAGKFFQDLGMQLAGEQWVKLRNIKCELQAGLWQGVLLCTSNVRFLPNEDSTVQDCLRSYQMRLAVSLDHYLPPSNMTEIVHKGLPFSTLRDANLWRAKEEGYIFRCIVRVIEVHPWDTNRFHRIKNDFCVLNLTLEDPTSRLHACLFGKNKEEFFNEHPLPVLKTKMNRLLGIPVNADASDNNICRKPPWVQMCLQACCEDKRQPWETRIFHICDSSLE